MKILNSLSAHHRTITTAMPDAISYSTTQKSHTIRYALSQEFERVKQLGDWVRTRTTRQWFFAIGTAYGVMLILAISLTAGFLTTHEHTYSFSQDNCFLNPIVLPKTISQTNDEAYRTTLRPTISIGSTPLISLTTCVEIAKIPEPKSRSTIKLKSPLSMQKTILLTPESLPQITAYDDSLDPISLDAVLLYSLDQQDKTFSYALQINDTKTDCILHSTVLGCPLMNHSLVQGKTYKYSLNRVLDSNSVEIMSSSLSTLDPVTVTSSSVAQDELIFAIPKSFTINVNKALDSVAGVSLKSPDGATTYPISPGIKGTDLTVSLDKNLPRNTRFTLTIQSMIATDGAYLPKPYTLSFKTSDGPKVQGVNIGSYRVSPSASITITFDIELDPAQNIAKYVSLETSNGIIPTKISIVENSLTLQPSAPIGACTTFSVRIKDGIKNKFGASGNSAWAAKSRTTCQQVFSIGNSVKGQSITAYRFGSGATKILYVGGMHGDEKSSVRTLNSFIDDLERNYSSIPSNKTVIVIPNTNPDGFAASTRVNSNTVDLNRNFPTFDWASGVYMPGNVFLKLGGGMKPLSEPESSALASYTTLLSPRVVLTFHATGRAVFANDAGDSKALADIYADKAGFTSFSNADSDTFFSYPTTGEYEDWVRDGLNLPALLIELAGVSNNEFTRQKPALWAMLLL